MTAPVDVLAALNRATGNLLRSRVQAIANSAVELREARAAIAELIESAQALSDSITFRIDDPRCELHCKLVDSLAIVGGAK